MIKKVVSIFLVFTMMMAVILPIAPASVASAESGVTIRDLQVSFDPDTQKMTVEGFISSGKGKQVTIRVVNPTDSVDYISQTNSGENGAFQFVFKPYVVMEGKYIIAVGGQDIDKPFMTEFIYEKKVAVTGVTLDKESATLKVGDTLELTAVVEPENATNKAVIWSSSNENVAFVDEDGVVTAIGAGTAVITVTTVDGGYTATCNVTVEKEEEEVTISDVVVDVDYEADNITVEGKISSGSGQNVTIMVIDPNGYHDFIGQTTSKEGGKFTFEFALNVKKTGTYTVKLGARGLATPYVTEFDYEYAVPVPVTGVTLDQKEAILLVNETLKLTATVEPENATNKAVIWSSNNEQVAIVNGDGLVLAVGEGTAVITVTTVDGGYTDTCTVTVGKITEIVTISDVTVDVDDTGKVTIEGKVSSGKGKEVTIRVFDPEGEIDFIGQTTSVEDGRFTFVFVPSSGISGKYTVKIGAVGVPTPYGTEFVYLYAVPVTGVTLNQKSATLKVNDTLKLTATVEPENATNKAVIWDSSNKQVAIVDQNGVVTAVGEGTATITVTTVDGGFTDTCIITVEKPAVEVTISDVKVTVDYEADKITVEGKVSSGSGKEVTIQVLDPDGNGDYVGQTTSGEGGKFAFVFALNVKKTGNYTVKLSALGVPTPYVTTFYYEYVVPVPVTGVKLDIKEAKLQKGEFLKLTATVEPENATNKDVVWSSSNDLVATVDQNGIVTAVGAGTATITVTTVDGGFTATCAITVEEVPGEVTISDVTIDVDTDTGRVTIEGKVSSGSGKEVTLVVIDPEGDDDYIGQTTSVENGKFTFVFTLYTQVEGIYTVKIGAAGVPTPYVTTFKYEYETTVPVTGVKLDKESATLQVGDILPLKATVEPENATNKAVIWSSSNEAVTTVDQNGVVTAVGEGTATITVTTVDGGFTATCAITVEKPPIPEVIISDVTVDVDYKADQIIVKGKVSSGSGKNVTIQVIDPSGYHDYIGQTTSGEGGQFTIVFTLNVKKTGEYTVKLGALGLTKPYVTTFYYEYVVTVPVTGVKLDKESATLKVGDTLELTATVEPENATNKAVIWSSSNEAVATVDQNGVVTAVGEGTATITVTTVDGGFTDTCIVKVEKQPIVVIISDVTVEVDTATGTVAVEGKVSSGSGKEVTIKVFDPKGEVDYIGQTTSAEDGSFRFVFTPRTDTDGTYTVVIGAYGVEKPFETTFEYVTIKEKPFDIIPVGSLERVGGIWATVNVKRVEGTPDHEGQEVVVFQLMKGSTPIAITAVKQDITSEVTATAMFNVIDIENPEYSVEVFVFNKFDSNTSTAPISLAEPEMMR